MKVCPHCGGAYPVAEGFCPMDGTRLRTLHATEGATPPQHADAVADAMLGTVLDRRYRLDALIGEGGMGLVFRATHVLIGKPLAVKVLRREHVESPDVARRFLLEARVASSLKHPNVVDISDFGEMTDGGAYYVMELLEGRTLANAIDQDGPMSPPNAVVVAAQICAGLSAAHALGVVHRDLKPDNVFLAEARHGSAHPVVKLLDFGIARAGPRRITVSGSVLGTPEYMSPEMAQGHDVDHRADLYALGVILFEMLSGSVPFYNKEIAKTLEMQVFAPRPTLASRKPELARLSRIGELVASLMAIERDARPRDADEAMRLLRSAWAHDLDAESAAVVQRATLAIGSNRMPETHDTARLGQWPPASQWPAGAPAAAGDRPASAPGRGPSPEPNTPTYVLPANRTRASGVRPTLIALSTAAVACAITLGIAKWLESSPATAAESSAPSDGTSVAPDEPVNEAAPSIAPVAPAIEPPAEPAAIEPQAQGGTIAVGSSTISTPPTPATPDVIPIAPEPSAHDDKTAAPVDRSKPRRRRVADPTVETSDTTPTSPKAPATSDPPVAPPAKPEPNAPGLPGHRPADLKDPFPGK